MKTTVLCFSLGCFVGSKNQNAAGRKLVLGSEVLYYILGNIVTWEWILQSNMIMGHTFF